MYGVSGTLGTAAHHDFLSRHYNVDTVIVPKYVDSPEEPYLDEFTPNYGKWIERIAETVRHTSTISEKQKFKQFEENQKQC